jgi:hypothetical protein
VLPILHLNGYKIANPTVLARIPGEELESLLRGYGYTVHVVEGDDPELVHQQLAATMDTVIGEIHAIQRRAREDGDLARPAWPAIVLRTPKGWTGPKIVDGLPVEGTWRAHQVPLSETRTNPEHLSQLEAWLRSYRAEELFDASGALVPELARLAPRDYRRMSANPHANGGLLLRDLSLPDFRDYAVQVSKPGASISEPTRVLGGLVMATRSGSVDPGLMLWLQEHAGMPAAELAATLEYRSGLHGLAGTGEMREVLTRAATGDERAELAREVYLHRLRGYVAAMAAAMDGLDALVFTGGVGENSAEIRSRAMHGLGFLGIREDAGSNAAGDGDREIGRPDAPVRSLVISAREDIEIARQVRATLQS